MRHVAIVALLAQSLTAGVTAQQVALTAGQRVRVTAAEAGIHQRLYSFEALRGDTLVLSDGFLEPNVKAFAVAELDRVEVARRRPTTLLAVVFGVVGGGIGRHLAGREWEECDWLEIICGREVEMALGGMAGAAAGIAIGYVLGTVTTRPWRPVPLEGLRVSVTPRRDGAVGLGLSVRF